MSARAAFERLLVAVVDVEEYAEQGGNLDRDAEEVRAALPEETSDLGQIDRFMRGPLLGKSTMRELDKAIGFLRRLVPEVAAARAAALTEEEQAVAAIWAHADRERFVNVTLSPVERATFDKLQAFAGRIDGDA